MKHFMRVHKIIRRSTPYCLCQEKTNNNKDYLMTAICQLYSMQLQKANPKQPSCKNSVQPLRRRLWKRCEIQGDGQEMAVMVG